MINVLEMIKGTRTAGHRWPFQGLWCQVDSLRVPLRETGKKGISRVSNSACLGWIPEPSIYIRVWVVLCLPHLLS